MSERQEEFAERIADARQRGDRTALAEALVGWAERTAVFSGTAEEIAVALNAADAFPIAEFRALPEEEARPREAGIEARRQARLAWALTALMQHEDAVRAGRLAVVLSADASDADIGWAARGALGVALARSGTRADEAGELARALAQRGAQNEKRDVGRAERLVAQIVQGDLALNAGQVGSAVAYFEEAFQLAKPLPEAWDGERTHALMALAGLHQVQQNAVRGLTRLQAARVIADQWSAPVEQFHARFGAANLLTGFQRYDEAVPLLEQSLALAPTHPQIRPLWSGVSSLLALNLTALGRLDEALERAQASYDLTLGEGDAPGHIQAAAVLSGVHRARQNFPDAYRVLSFAAARLQLGGQQEASDLVRRMVGELRESMGAEAFDAMAERMAEAEREKRRLRGELPAPDGATHAS